MPIQPGQAAVLGRPLKTCTRHRSRPQWPNQPSPAISADDLMTRVQPAIPFSKIPCPFINGLIGLRLCLQNALWPCSAVPRTQHALVQDQLAILETLENVPACRLGRTAKQGAQPAANLARTSVHLCSAPASAEQVRCAGGAQAKCRCICTAPGKSVDRIGTHVFNYSLDIGTPQQAAQRGASSDPRVEGLPNTMPTFAAGVAVVASHGNCSEPLPIHISMLLACRLIQGPSCLSENLPVRRSLVRRGT
jgi:hypothetical protein